MKVVEYAVERDKKTRKPLRLELAAGSLIPTEEDLELTWEVGERYVNDPFGHNLIFSYHGEDSDFSLLDVIVPNLPDDVVETILNTDGITISDSGAGITLVCGCATAVIE